MRRSLPGIAAIALWLTVAGAATAAFTQLGSSPEDSTGGSVAVFASGNLEQTNALNGEAIVTGSNLGPGDTRSGIVSIANTGSLAADFTLAGADIVDTPGPGGGPLSSVLNLSISDISVLVTPIAVYGGPLATMPPQALGTFRPGAQRTYRFKIAFPSDSANEYKNSAFAASFVWTATAQDEGSPPPPGGSNPPPSERPPTSPPPGGGGDGSSLTVKAPRGVALTKPKGALVFTARCATKCKVSASAVLTTGKAPKQFAKQIKKLKKKLKKFKLKARPVAAAAGKPVRFALKLSKKQAALLRKELKASKKLKVKIVVKITVVAVTSSGRRITKTVVVKLKP